MNLFFSCNEGLENCMKTKRFSISHLFTEEKTHKIHIHDCYEILYLIFDYPHKHYTFKYFEV